MVSNFIFSELTLMKRIRMKKDRLTKYDLSKDISIRNDILDGLIQVPKHTEILSYTVHYISNMILFQKILTDYPDTIGKNLGNLHLCRNSTILV